MFKGNLFANKNRSHHWSFSKTFVRFTAKALALLENRT